MNLLPEFLGGCDAMFWSGVGIRIGVKQYFGEVCTDFWCIQPVSSHKAVCRVPDIFTISPW